MVLHPDSQVSNPLYGPQELATQLLLPLSQVVPAGQAIQVLPFQLGKPTCDPVPQQAEPFVIESLLEAELHVIVYVPMAVTFAIEPDVSGCNDRDIPELDGADRIGVHTPVVLAEL